MSEPYRIFFPLGFLLGLWGVALWLLYSLSSVPYPAMAHSYIMVGGFLTAFTSGFLMTAVPRFTGTFFVEAYECMISLLGMVVLPFVAFYSETFSSLLVIIIHSNLIIFFMRRFLRRKAPLPTTFLFIPASLFVSVLGHLVLIGVNLGWLGGENYALARLLTMHAFMLGLVLGVGSRIIPAFLGHGPFQVQNGWVYGLVILVFFSTYGLQLLAEPRWALLLRFLAVMPIAVMSWKIQNRPMNPSKLSYGIWISCWGLLGGLLGAIIQPSQFIAWNHILFISGFALMTLMIGSRVVISHGGFDLAHEGERFWVNNLIVILVITSGLRVLLHVWPAATGLLLLLSATLWILALVYWWYNVGHKISFKLNPKLKSSC